MRTPFVGTATGYTTLHIQRERKLETKIEQRLDRRLNKLLGISKQLRHPWQLACINGPELDGAGTWEEFIKRRSLEVVAITNVEHTTIVAGCSWSLLGPRPRFYWCPGFPWDSLEAVRARYRQLWRVAEENQTSSGPVFFYRLATVWGGRPFSSRKELTALENSDRQPDSIALREWIP